jgi:hypothetical protein
MIYDEKVYFIIYGGSDEYDQFASFFSGSRRYFIIIENLLILSVKPEFFPNI